MKQKVNISWLPIRIGCWFLLISIPQLLSAQEYSDSTRITRDSVALKPESSLQLSPSDFLPIEISAYPLDPAELYPTKPLGDFRVTPRKGAILLPYQTNPSLLFRGDYSTGGILKQFPHGTLFGSGKQTSVPGIGLFNNASLGYQHAFGENFALQLSANAMKINMSHITGQAFSTSGALLYRPAERVALKLFGTYDIGNSYGMSTHSYGATAAFDMTERFNLEMGVQRYYDAMRGRWETVPVVIPSYRFEKFKLGLDVGGILYEILRGTVFDRGGFDRGGGSPTIAAPRFSLPIR